MAFTETRAYELWEAELGVRHKITQLNNNNNNNNNVIISEVLVSIFDPSSIAILSTFPMKKHLSLLYIYISIL
jgi:hypothetical protein